MIDNGDTDYKIVWQGQDSILFRLTGWRADVPMWDLDVDSDYRFIISFDTDTGRCPLEFMRKVEDRTLRLDVMDYKNKYAREGKVFRYV